MTRVLVTGGAGFIGSQLVRALVASGHEVGVVLRPDTAVDRLDGAAAAAARIFSADLADADAVIASLEGWRPESCAHLAWYAEPRTYLQSTENVAQLISSLSLLPRLAEAGCKHFVVTGTCAEYAPSADRLTETSPAGPATLYAACKLALHGVLEQLSPQAAFTVAWARLFHLYGPRERPERLVPSVIRSLLRGEPFLATAGDQVRDFLHVSDVASALGTLVANRAQGTFNVCSGVDVTVRTVVETIAGLLGKADLVRFGAIPSRPWDPAAIRGDNSRLLAEGWRPRHDLRSGLEETIAWWREVESIRR